ncbi:MAG: hypothetical protein LBF24_02985 [Puniceicoccales bacterium]|nr:hypothetical protein [Puniceicoccales bacterium]
MAHSFDGNSLTANPFVIVRNVSEAWAKREEMGGLWRFILYLISHKPNSIQLSNGANRDDVVMYIPLIVKELATMSKPEQLRELTAGQDTPDAGLVYNFAKIVAEHRQLAEELVQLLNIAMNVLSEDQLKSLLDHGGFFSDPHVAVASSQADGDLNFYAFILLCIRNSHVSSKICDLARKAFPVEEDLRTSSTAP